MSVVQLSEINLSFGDHRVLSNVDLEIEDNDYVVVVGASGCGKTSLLRMVAGLLEPTSGTIRIRGKDVSGLSPRDLDIAYVPQQTGLYPHLPIRRSIEMGIQERAPKSEKDRRVRSAAEMVGIETLLDRFPSQLSGGQVRRASLAKAVARGASVRLLDEPLSAIDAGLRHQIEADLVRMHRDLGGVTVHVTHDASEAMRIATKIAVISQGTIVQYDSPEKGVRYLFGSLGKHPESP